MAETKNLCDDAAFRAVFMRYGESIRNFIYAKCNDLALAEDITQDVFVTLWQRCADADPETVKSFLYKIASNRVIDYFRRNKVAANYISNRKSSVDHISPQFLLEEQEYKVKLDRVLMDIPEPSRIVFLMSRMERLKYDEIAERLDISVKAVEKRMHKALLIIKSRIGKKI